MAGEPVKILACIDDSATARRVLETADTLKIVFGATVEAFHVREPTGDAPVDLARWAEVPMTLGRGEEVRAITDAIASPDVVAGVLGARRDPTGARPAGHVAMAVMSVVDTPVVGVPPSADGPVRPWRRVLVPLDGHPSSSRAVAGVLRLLDAAHVEVVVLHVFDERTVPSFWDQAHHATAAWVDELGKRQAGTSPSPTVELRAGSAGEQVQGVAWGYDVDAVVLGWSRSFDEGRARTVRHALAESQVPVVLLPVHGGTPEPGDERSGRGPERPPET